MFQIKQNETTAVRRRIPILLVDITDGFTPETGITAPTVNISKNGGTVASGAGTFAEIGNGQYYYEFTAGEVDTLGWIAVNLEKATVTRDYNAVVQVMAYDAMDVVRLGLTAIPNVAQGISGALPTGNATGQVTVATNNDKTGYALTQTFPANFSSLAITAGGAVTAGTVSDKSGYSLATSQTFSTTGSVGSVTGSVASVTGSVGSVTGAVGSVTGNVGGNVTGSVGSLTATAVQNIWDDTTASLTTVGSIGKLLVDNVNATISSRSTLTDAQVWSSATRTLTAGTNIVLAKGTGITGFNDITALSVWDVLASTVSVTGSMGLQLKTNVDATVSSRLASASYTAPLTTTGTAQAVWNAATASYIANGSFGERVLRSSSTQATVAVTGSNHVASDVHAFQPDVIDATALATSAVTEIQTGLATSTAVSGISTVTTKLDTTMQQDGAVYQFTANALELAPAGGGGGGSTTNVRPGPFMLKADNGESGEPLDIVTGSVCNVQVQCVDANGTGVDLSGASSVQAKVYASNGTLVTTYTCTVPYAVMGHALIPLTTTVTNTVGTYIVNVVSTVGTTVTIFGPLKMYVRQN